MNPWPFHGSCVDGMVRIDVTTYCVGCIPGIYREGWLCHPSGVGLTWCLNRCLGQLTQASTCSIGWRITVKWCNSVVLHYLECCSRSSIENLEYYIRTWDGRSQNCVPTEVQNLWFHVDCSCSGPMTSNQLDVSLGSHDNGILQAWICSNYLNAATFTYCNYVTAVKLGNPAVVHYLECCRSSVQNLDVYAQNWNGVQNCSDWGPKSIFQTSIKPIAYRMIVLSPPPSSGSNLDAWKGCTVLTWGIIRQCEPQ